MTSKHLHPLTLARDLWQVLWTDAILILLMLTSHIEKYLPFWLAVVLLLVVSVGWTVVRYLRFTYELGATALTINSGIFIREERHIPYERIQSLQTRQWFYMIPFDVETIRIETSGKSDDNDETELSLVKKSVYLELKAHQQRQLSDAGQPSQATPIETAPVENAGSYKISGRDLNTYALTSMGIVPVLVLLIVVYFRVDDFLPKQWLQNSVKLATHGGLVIVGAAILGILVAATLVSYVQLLARYFGFTLSKNHQQLTSRKGFFQSKEVTGDVGRIQAVIIAQSIIRQLFHLATVKAVLSTTVDEEDDESDMLLLPVVRQSRALSTMQPFVAWLPHSLPEMTMIGRSGRFRMIRNVVWPTIIVWGGLAWFSPRWAWIGIVLPVIAWLLGRYASKHTGVGQINDDYIVAESGSLFSRKMTIMPRNRIQAISRSQSIWMKRVGLAHLNLSLRSGDEGVVVTVRYLPEDVVKHYYDWYREGEKE